ncbi:hypothetical protein [Neoaquamicrobium sediminum]|uniref:hypothetical protein n=1 Tax=Neoaquamicrobium sediminum TaxID=1849104 RepID=UPI003BA9C69F
MQAWLESVAGPDYAPALMWTVVALIVLLVLLIVIRIVRGFTFGTFVAGGRNRKARLAVMDATAVDSHRRLVLVRRDDVEHLILIGGPSDVVVEQNIRLLPPARKPADDMPVVAQPPATPPQPVVERPHAPRSEIAVRATPPRPQQQPAPQRVPVAEPAPAATPEPRFPASPTTNASAAPTPQALQPAPAPAPAPAVQTLRPVVADPETHRAEATKVDDIDDALLEELQVTLDGDQRRQATVSPEISLDDEMSRLLGDLSSKR